MLPVSIQTRWASLPTFSLRECFIAMVALAIGFSLWSLPHGNWLDIPVAALSFYFVRSLLQRAIANRRLLLQLTDLSPDQRLAGRLVLAGQILLALLLVVAIGFRFLAANDQLPNRPDNYVIDYASIPTLPRDLAMLAMLAILGLAFRNRLPAKTLPASQYFFSAFAVLGLLIAILLYWADRMLIPVLVYIAISSIEIAQPTQFLSPEMNLSSAIRIQRFTAASLTGLSWLLANLLLLAALTKLWPKFRWRCLLLTLLALGLAAQAVVVVWFVCIGVRQLSPPLAESFQWPVWHALVLAGLMIVLAAAAFSWRWLVQYAPCQQPLPALQVKRFFHETWYGGLLFSLVALAQVVDTIIGSLKATLSFRSRISSQTMDWQTFFAILTFTPGQFIWFAAAIGGFTVTWIRYRQRASPAVNTLASINMLQFAVTTFSLAIMFVTGAVIIAASSFSYWFVRFGKVL